MVKDLLISSDVEVAATEPNSGKIPQLVPPAWLIYRKGMKIIGWRGKDEEEKAMHPVFIEKDEISWYQDGALCETDFPPTSSAEELYGYFRLSKEILIEFLQSEYNLEVWSKPVARFNVEKYIKMGDSKIKEACIAGCDPDLDAIEEEYACEVRDLTEWDYRSCGGHLHMSVSPEYGNILHDAPATLVRLLAITVGNVAIATSSNPTLEQIRRRQFGNPGRYRLPTYPDGREGLEYRSLSVDWLNSLETVELIFNATRFALTLFLEDFNEAVTIIDHYLVPTTEAILFINPDISKQILSNFKLL